MEAGRDREDDVEIGHGQKIVRPRLLPAHAFQPLALGTVPVTTRIVGDLLVPAAAVTLPDMTAERCCTTAQDRGNDPALLRV